MLKVIKIWLVVMILAITLSAGCAKSPPRENNMAPDFKLKSLDGQTITLSALRGRAVLLNFWATWCGPCRFEMPFLQELYKDSKWQARGLLILAVNLQESDTVVRKFLAENALSFAVLLDTGGEAARLYNVASIPTTYIIGKDGIIKNSRIGAFTNKTQIEQTLLSSVAED
jgi:peroxiredoxin